jgi:UDP-glucose 4-epimerase
METVLVTGGAGFIGSHTCKALTAAGFLPVAFDNLSKGHADLAPPRSPISVHSRGVSPVNARHSSRMSGASPLCATCR